MPNLASLLAQPRPSCSVSALWGDGELFCPNHEDLSSAKFTGLLKATPPLVFRGVGFPSPICFAEPMERLADASWGQWLQFLAPLRGKDRTGPQGSLVPM